MNSKPALKRGDLATTAPQQLSEAAQLHRQGRLDEAERIYQEVLAADPRQADALHLLGLLKHEQGRSAEGLRLVAAALQAKPSSTAMLSSHGVILAALKRHEEALASFDRVLTSRGADASAHYNRAGILSHMGRHADAIAGYDAALALKPDLTDAHYNRGNLLAALGRNEEALASYDRALKLAPGRADIRNNRSTQLIALERFDQALEALDQLLAETPNDIAALNNRGNVLVRLERLDEALCSYDKALALSPRDADALNNRGLLLAKLGRYEEALSHYAEALDAAPTFIDAHLNRANALVALNRIAEALRSYGDAITLDPHHPDANFNLALSRLCLGDFAKGWKGYEYRWQTKKYAPARPDYPRPMWRGEQELNGKVILLTAEQGLGDAIQFVRYAPLLAARGAKVLLGVHRPLATLMTSVPGITKVMTIGDVLPHFDFYCPLLSLPMAFGTEIATIPANVPYVRPHQERVAQWRERVPASGRLRVGICWAGTKEHFNNQRRSIPLERFARILALPGIDFVSLQNDVTAAETALLRDYGVAGLGQDFADFADTAAVISMLDLVIAVDTSVAHLAGAMAKAAGVLIPFSPDFRWMLDRTDSPWYPTMRLFRQTVVDDWSGPLDRLYQELEALAAKRASA